MAARLIARLGINATTALLCGEGTVAAVWGLTRDVRGSRVARGCAVERGAGGHMVADVCAPLDSPMLLFWMLAPWALWCERWLWAELACILALLSKYPAVLLGLAFLLAAARAWRPPWGAWVTTGTLAVQCFVPVAQWNARTE